MKRSILFLAVIAGFITACSSDQSSSSATDSTELIAEDTTFTATQPPKENGTECYAYIKNKDTATLKLTITGEEVTGDLNYKLFEKDSNKGTIAGEIKGDTIIAEYIFDSEGLRSVREIVFLKKDGKLVEGFGETEDKKGKITFKNRAELTFGDAMVFSKTSCP